MSVSQCNVVTFTHQLEENILEYTLEDGTTLLMAAAFSGCVSIAKSLVQIASSKTWERSYIDAVGFHGLNALMIAASRGHSDIIRVLVSEGGTEINARHKFASTTSLHMVLRRMTSFFQPSRLC